MRLRTTRIAAVILFALVPWRLPAAEQRAGDHVFVARDEPAAPDDLDGGPEDRGSARIRA